MIADVSSHLLHAVARLALRLAPPLRAKRVVELAARCLPRLDDARDAVELASKLEGHGTCLSRAMTVAARLTGARVVIGVPNKTDPPFQAHAWVEFRGRPLRPTDVIGTEIASV